ncbi:hypothetical protein [Stenotrophomonas maltophilia]|uniref:hypothetical protein n=1 Tax=Stenotrophomonas maltophilia TaxID=40324 RepID=UPI001953B400|nr:hypothetical protein [Stenotrophomonas maltophilia]
MRRFDQKEFRAMAWAAEPDKAAWLLDAEGAIEFLKNNATCEELVIYASAGAVLIHGVLAPTAQVTPADQTDLLGAHVMSDDSWCIQKSWGGGQGHRIYLEPPLTHPGCKSLVGGEKLIFRRSFTGVDTGPAPIELSQKLVHSLELYWVPERSAYSRLDSKGDVEDVIRVIWLKAPESETGAVVVTILIKELATYMALSDLSLVIKFDFTRFEPDNFAGWAQDRQSSRKLVPDLFYNAGRSTNASYANGCMILRAAVTVDELIQQWKEEEDPTRKQYATFKIQDWKNQRSVETSCAPEFLSNYFTQSDKPYEISPVFFRSDVLARFKNDPEKYDLTDRTISCRNAWYLKTYDINEAGQVHTYIGYLADLPYEEQLYWQSFNEWPKAPISKRAFENDFQGQFSSEYDPLQMIKYKIRQLDEAPPPWWKPRGSDLLDAARYPATDSVSEWGDEILALDQLLVEGFLQRPLQKLAAEAGRMIDKQWQSLRLLQDYLEAQGCNAEEAKVVMEPLVRLHKLRSVLKGHGAPSERTAASKQARTEHGTLRAHFTALAGECDATFIRILAVFGVAIKLD